MTDTDPFTDPPTHQMILVSVSRRMVPGRDYIILDGHEWQVADCWAQDGESKEVFWCGVSFGVTDVRWMIEAVRRTR